MGAPELDESVARARGLRRRDELDTEAVAALTGLGSAGVEAVLLKGPALARRLYGECETRGYSDIDLLVPHRDLVSARGALVALGYADGGAAHGIDDVAGIKHAEVWVRAGEAGDPVLIDLHWRLDRCEAPDDLIWGALVAGRGSINIRGEEVAVLGDDGLQQRRQVRSGELPAAGLARFRPVQDSPPLSFVW